MEPRAISRPLHFVLICPPVGVSTAAVYRKLTPPDRPRPIGEMVEALEAGDIPALGRGLFNRLQEPAVRLDARIGEYYKRLVSLAPAGVLMSGSGSSLFAVCRSPTEQERLTAALRDGAAEDLLRVFAVRGCV